MPHGCGRSKRYFGQGVDDQVLHPKTKTVPGYNFPHHETEEVMCFQVYLGSYSECPEIPYGERSDDRTLFPDAYNIALFVHKHPEHSGFSGTVAGLSAPYQYHLGIMPCGCGFALEHPPGEGWEYYAQRQLGDYLSKCVERSEPLELLSFWDRDHDKPVEHHRSITYDELYDPQFFFKERQMTLVYKDEASLKSASG
jgi:hypothetical protein